MTVTDTSVMSRLKSETSDLHQYAEQRPLQRAMAQGEIERDRYARYLGQLLLVHGALEAALRRVRKADPSVAALVDDDRFHEPRLRDDVTFLGLDPEAIEAHDATGALMITIEQIEARGPRGLLGLMYVLEGSTNGGRFLAKSINRGLGLTSGQGTSYLDPYGERQRERWLSFRASMDEQPWSDADADSMLDAARVMFQGIADVSDAVNADG